MHTNQQRAFGGRTGPNRAACPIGLETIEYMAFWCGADLMSLAFPGGTPPDSLAENASLFFGRTGSVYYPVGANGYDEAWKDSVGLSGWTLKLTYRLMVKGGADDMMGGLYQKGDLVRITAAPSAGRRIFDRWISSGGGAFADEANPDTAFIMPDAHITVTAVYKNEADDPGSAGGHGHNSISAESGRTGCAKS